MPAAAFSYQFPLPPAPIDGAWTIAVALVAKADFTQQMPVVELLLTDLFPAAEIVNDNWLQEALGRASGFSIDVYEEAISFESAVSSMSMFSQIGDRKNPSCITAEFNYRPQAQLQQLQAIIHQLAALNKLRPAVLQTRLKALAPLTVFNVKSNPRYKEPIFSGFLHKGELVTSPLIFSEE